MRLKITWIASRDKTAVRRTKIKGKRGSVDNNVGIMQDISIPVANDPRETAEPKSSPCREYPEVL